MIFIVLKCKGNMYIELKESFKTISFYDVSKM